MTKQEKSRTLQRWHEHAEQVIGLFDVKGERIQRKDQAKAKLLFNDLKQELGAEHKRLSSMPAREALSPSEVASYKAALDEALLALSRVKSNSTPDVHWFTALDQVLLCLEGYERADLGKKVKA
ncbi:MAG: hypothetical protein ACJ746_29390 [Bryobacteraceae bacterium]